MLARTFLQRGGAERNPAAMAGLHRVPTVGTQRGCAEARRCAPGVTALPVSVNSTFFPPNIALISPRVPTSWSISSPGVGTCQPLSYLFLVPVQAGLAPELRGFTPGRQYQGKTYGL
jgi:hypothetical protein